MMRVGRTNKLLYFADVSGNGYWLRSGHHYCCGRERPVSQPLIASAVMYDYYFTTVDNHNAEDIHIDHGDC
jgi:hypothetical protein